MNPPATEPPISALPEEHLIAPSAPANVNDGTTTSQRLELDSFFDKLEKKPGRAPTPRQPNAPKTTANLPPESASSATPETEPKPAAAAPAEKTVETPAKPVEQKPSPPSEAQPASAEEDEDEKAAKAALENPHLNKHQKRPWDKFTQEREAHKLTKSELKKLQERAEAAERERDTFKTTAEARANYDELNKRAQEAEQERDRYRSIIELDDDPKFQEKFTTRAQNLNGIAEKVISTVIPEKKYKYKDEGSGAEIEGLSVEYLRGVGGIAGFARMNPAGYRQLLDRLEARNPVAAESLRRTVGSIGELEVEREQEISRLKSERGNLTQSRQQQEQERQQARERQIAQINEQLGLLRNKEYERHDAFKIQPIPEKATAQERAALESRNKEAEANRNNLKILHEVLFTGKATPDHLAEGALRAVLFPSERAARLAAENEVKRLTDEVARLKNAQFVKPAGTITPAPASARRSNPAPVAPVEGANNVAKNVLEIAEQNARERAQRNADTLA